MSRYRVEILGKVPNGYTQTDVFAGVNSSLRESATVESVTKRKLAGGYISIIAKFEAENVTAATVKAMRAGNSVVGFSCDVMAKEID